MIFKSTIIQLDEWPLIGYYSTFFVHIERYKPTLTKKRWPCSKRGWGQKINNENRTDYIPILKSLLWTRFWISCACIVEKILLIQYGILSDTAWRNPKLFSKISRILDMKFDTEIYQRVWQELLTPKKCVTTTIVIILFGSKFSFLYARVFISPV